MPETALADAGYCNEAELVRLEERGVDAGGQGPLRAAQVALGGPERLDQGGDGLPALSVRGLAKARGERDLAFPALNVVRMGRLAAA